MFSFLALHIRCFFPQIQLVTWNYHEAGHGKGAPDGIEGTCKRTADQVICQGKDIPNFTELVKVLNKNCPGVRILTIFEEEVSEMTELIYNETILTFSGTMKVHQIKTYIGTGILHMKTLSCFKCSDHCQHYALGTLIYKSPVNIPAHCNISTDGSDDDIPLSVVRKRSTPFYPSVYSDNDIDDDVIKNPKKFEIYPIIKNGYLQVHTF